MKSWHQCISHKFLNSYFFWFLPSKCFYIIPMGCRTSLKLKVIISIVSLKQNVNLRIQILAGNTLMPWFHVDFEIELPLDFISRYQKKIIWWTSEKNLRLEDFGHMEDRTLRKKTKPCMATSAYNLSFELLTSNPNLGHPPFLPRFLDSA